MSLSDLLTQYIKEEGLTQRVIELVTSAGIKLFSQQHILELMLNLQKFEEFISQNDNALAVELGETEVDQHRKLDPPHTEETEDENGWQLSVADYEILVNEKVWNIGLKLKISHLKLCLNLGLLE